jgi:hypothetical protein
MAAGPNVSNCDHPIGWPLRQVAEGAAAAGPLLPMRMDHQIWS